MDKQLRLMNREEDFAKLGLNPECVEVWEDQKRTTREGTNWEWWYFDAVFDDGSTAVIQFLEPSLITPNKTIPAINFLITRPDGKFYRALPLFDDDSLRTFGEGKCDVHYGDNYFIGDMKDYHIHVEPVNGMAADLHVKNLATPYRPATGYWCAGDNEEDYYTWLCVVPKGEVSGTITVDGETIPVHGYGYHDHQWGNRYYWEVWNHWTWARQRYEDYTVLAFDMITRKEFGYVEHPIFFVQDKNGQIIAQNFTTEGFEKKIEGETFNETVQKYCPDKQSFSFENRGRKISYSLEPTSVLQAFELFKGKPESELKRLKADDIRHCYLRFMGNGKLIIEDNGEVIEREAPLLYEFMYPGDTYKV